MSRSDVVLKIFIIYCLYVWGVMQVLEKLFYSVHLSQRFYRAVLIEIFDKFFIFSTDKSLDRKLLAII
jgi:hypothetical protein